MRQHVCRVIFLSVVLALLAHAPVIVQGLPQAEFADDHRIDNDAGHVSLKWSAEGEDLEYELQEAMEPDFETPTRIYLGGDDMSFRSGLEDGTFYYRVRARKSGTEAWGAWSQPVEFVCKHHSLTSALVLFASGAVLFVLLIFFVVVNACDLRRFEDNESTAELESQHA